MAPPRTIPHVHGILQFECARLISWLWQGAFCQVLSAELANEAKPAPLRQLAGLIIKNTLAARVRKARRGWQLSPCSPAARRMSRCKRSGSRPGWPSTPCSVAM